MNQRILTFTSALLLLCVAALSQTAAAHSSMAQSIPPDGATLKESPPTYSMSFEQPVRLTLVTLTRSADGFFSFLKSGTDVPVAVNTGGMNAEYTIELPKLADGDYTVEWRALAQDGHAMSGHVHFTVDSE